MSYTYVDRLAETRFVLKKTSTRGLRLRRPISLNLCEVKQYQRELFYDTGMYTRHGGPS